MNGLDITPNAAKTISSLRYLTYSNETALADIVDNSLDAEADNVDVIIDNDSITIIDDGYGMDWETLCEAIKLGSNTDKDISKLGKFGMGLVTASISMAKKLTVASKPTDGKVNCVCLDLNKIENADKWVADKVDLSQDEVNQWEKRGCGTIVRLEDIDHYKYKNTDTLVTKTISHFGEVFRKYIDAGRVIKINGTTVAAVDPIALKNESTNILLDEDIDHNGNIFHMTVVEVDPNHSDLSLDFDTNMRNQGFYVVRNNRQIAHAITLGNFVKHNSSNRFRCEISYSSDLDDQIGINFTKDKIEVTQSLEDKIMSGVRMGLNIIKKNSLLRTASEAENATMDHSDAEGIIQRKKTLLPSPTLWKEKHIKRAENEQKPDDENNTPDGDDEEEKKKKIRQRAKRIQLGYRGLNAKFIQENSGPSNPLFDYDNEGSDIIIKWNVSHPFYAKFVAPFNKDKNISSPIDLLAFSIALAEYQVADDDGQNEKMLQLREEYSRILRTLMG